jgi:RimJ/RimL family protein N-acetyltransferase
MLVPRISDGQHPDPIVLRRHTTRDVDAIVAMCQDEQVQRWTTVPVPYLPEHAEQFVTGLAADAEQGSSLTFAIEALDDGGSPRYAGNLALRLDDAGAGEVGFVLAPWARGRGVMSRALRMAMTYGFRELSLQVVHWRAHEGNWPSRRVAWACGFRVEGLVRGLLTSRGVRYDGWVASLVRGEPMAPAHPWLSVPHIVGDRVVLRQWREDDVARVAEACADPVTQHWLAHLPSPYQLADAQFYVRSREEQHATARGLYWCVADPDTDLCLASVALFGLTGSYPEPEVGYWAHPDARGRGAMTEATRLVLRHAVLPATDGGLGLRRVCLRAAAANAASIAVADAAGMTRFGTARAAEQLRDGSVEDLALFDILAAEVVAPSARSLKRRRPR